MIRNIFGIPNNTHYVGYLSRKLSFWLFKIQKCRTFSLNVNDILRLCTIVVNIAIRSRA